MTDSFIPVEQYLGDVINYDKRCDETDLWLKEILKRIKTEAVARDDQETAKKAWCYETIHRIQKNYLAAFRAMKEGDFYDAWCLLERVEIDINSLSKHYVFSEDDPYKVLFIEKHTKQFQSLYPYRLFISPAFLHLEKECSICGSRISIRNPCGHKKGNIYNGEMCVHKITKADLLEISIVTNPVQKYSVLFLNDPESGEQVDHYDYSLVRYVVTGLRQPFDGWDIQKTRIRHPHSLFAHLSAMDDCPCGSGKLYGECCLQEPDGVLRPHIQILFHVKPNGDLPQIVYPKYDDDK